MSQDSNSLFLLIGWVMKWLDSTQLLAQLYRLLKGLQIALNIQK